MGLNLRSALHDYTRDPAVAPLDAGAVRRRVDRRRSVRMATTGLVATAACALVVATAYGLTRTDPLPPVPAASPSTVVTSTPTPTASPSASPSPSPTPSPTVTPSDSTETPGGTDPDPGAMPVFRTGARVGDFPSNAPEAEVVAYLSERLAVAAEAVDPSTACGRASVPGRQLSWPGTGVGLRIRTTDDDDQPVSPYVAAWTLMEPSQMLGLGTDSGLVVGLEKDAVPRVAPRAVYGEQEISGMLQWWFVVPDEAGEILVVGGETSIYRIESGYGCGE